MREDDFTRRAAGLEWLLFDVDGVLTDGLLYYSARGETLKRFNAKDGLAFRLAQRAGLRLGLLTGRRSKPLEKRARELDFDTMIYGSKNKLKDFEGFLKQKRTTPGRVAYIGDDLPDLPVLCRCALAFAPADAAEEVRAAVHRVLEASGGRGAAREMIESLLKARGQWDEILSVFSGEG
jgi:3-deoxy-D-manno-octulosonate 8-phosphate phosphatase (KDO 8-P phosphatase)